MRAAFQVVDASFPENDFSAERWQWAALQVMLYGGPGAYVPLLRGLPSAMEALDFERQVD